MDVENFTEFDRPREAPDEDFVGDKVKPPVPALVPAKKTAKVPGVKKILEEAAVLPEAIGAASGVPLPAVGKPVPAGKTAGVKSPASKTAKVWNPSPAEMARAVANETANVFNSASVGATSSERAIDQWLSAGVTSSMESALMNMMIGAVGLGFGSSSGNTGPPSAGAELISSARVAEAMLAASMASSSASSGTRAKAEAVEEAEEIIREGAAEPAPVPVQGMSPQLAAGNQFGGKKGNTTNNPKGNKGGKTKAQLATGLAVGLAVGVGISIIASGVIGGPPAGGGFHMPDVFTPVTPNAQGF